MADATTAQATSLASAAAQHWDLPAPQLLRVGHERAVRVRRRGPAGQPSRRTGCAGRSLELAELLAARGIRVPLPARDDVVADGELAATAWHRLVSVDTEPDWQEVGRMVAEVHAIDARSLPTGSSLPPCESFPWWHFDERLAEVDAALDARARAGLVDGDRTARRVDGAASNAWCATATCTRAT